MFFKFRYEGCKKKYITFLYKGFCCELKSRILSVSEQRFSSSGREDVDVRMLGKGNPVHTLELKQKPLHQPAYRYDPVFCIACNECCRLFVGRPFVVEMGDPHRVRLTPEDLAEIQQVNCKSPVRHAEYLHVQTMQCLCSSNIPLQYGILISLPIFFYRKSTNLLM